MDREMIWIWWFITIVPALGYIWFNGLAHRADVWVMFGLFVPPMCMLPVIAQMENKQLQRILAWIAGGMILVGVILPGFFPGEYR